MHFIYTKTGPRTIPRGDRGCRDDAFVVIPHRSRFKSGILVSRAREVCVSARARVCAQKRARNEKKWAGPKFQLQLIYSRNLFFTPGTVDAPAKQAA